MSGICGIFLHGRADKIEPDDLSPILRAMDSTGRREAHTVCVDSVGLGAQDFVGRKAGAAKTTVHHRPFALAFHGSVYNLKELFPREPFGSDPSAGLLRLYLEEGMTFLAKLRGEFVLSLWDGLNERLCLATDRFRICPLFYYHDREKLVFASRVRGILASPLHIERTIDPRTIVDVVSSSVIPTPRTVFNEVRKLPPGHVLTYQNGEMKIAPYWEINFLHPDRSSEADLAGKLKSRLTDSISARLESEGASDQIGSFLSGGIDSSTVTGVLTQLTKGPLKSFSIGFDEQRFNEISYARIAAQAFKAQHYEYFVTPKDTVDAIPVLLDAFDEPFANASAIPTFFCAKMARERGVSVLYSGDGGDELFAGNERYATERLFEYYSEIPEFFRETLIKPLVFALADKPGWKFFVRGKKYIQRASIPYPRRLWSYGFFMVVPMQELLEEGFQEIVGTDYHPDAAMERYYFQAPAQSELDRQLYIDLKLTISDNDLFKVTRMTEAAGVTVRFPFLDHRLAEFAAEVPADIKMRGRELRSFFKKAYSELLPIEVRTKKKHGFGLPIPMWLRTDKRLNEMMHDLVLSPQSVQRGYFRESALRELIDRHRTDETSFYGTTLWNLMVLELWHRKNAAGPRR